MIYFIPGLFSGPIHYVFGTYFVDQFTYLKSLGKDYEMLPINTENSVSDNAVFIKNFIEDKSGLTFITHSKGGLDLLDALITYPEMRSKIKKIVFIQAPFYGTPLVNLVKKNLSLKLMAMTAFKLSKGKWNTLDEISILKRKEYMEHYALEIKEVLEEMDITSIGSVVDYTKTKTTSLLYPLIKYLKSIGMEGDGVVPLESTKLTGAVNLRVEGIDHSSMVVKRTIQKFDRKAFTSYLFDNDLTKGNHDYSYQ